MLNYISLASLTTSHILSRIPRNSFLMMNPRSSNF